MKKKVYELKFDVSNGVFSFTSGGKLKGKTETRVIEVDSKKQEVRSIDSRSKAITTHKFSDLKGVTFTITASLNPRFVLVMKSGVSVRYTPKGTIALPLVNNKVAKELLKFIKTKTKLKVLKRDF